MLPTHIVCATDLDETSEPALRLAGELAQALSARLTVVHVIEPITVVPGLETYSLDGMPADWEQRVEQGRNEAVHRRLAQIAGQCAGVACTARVLEGPLPSTLTDALRELKADLLVLGTHGRSGVAHFLLGSVAEKTLRQAPCPVLVVPPPH